MIDEEILKLIQLYRDKCVTKKREIELSGKIWNYAYRAEHAKEGLLDEIHKDIMGILHGDYKLVPQGKSK